jgi:hypothetical protein
MIQPLRGVPGASLSMLKPRLFVLRNRHPDSTRTGKTANASRGNLATPFPRQEEFYWMCFLNLQNSEPEPASGAGFGVAMGVKACQIPLLDDRFEVGRRCGRLHPTRGIASACIE